MQTAQKSDDENDGLPSYLDNTVSRTNVDARISQLRALLSVIRTGSYAQSGKELSYTESGIFLQIRSLEKSLGVQLVVRREHPIRLTPAGEVVWRYAGRIVRDVDGLSREALRAAATSSVTVGAGRATASIYMIPLVARYRDLHPEDAVNVHIEPAHRLLADIEDGLLDVVICGSITPILNEDDRRRFDLRCTPWRRGAAPSLICPRVPASDDRRRSYNVYIPEYLAYNLEAISSAVEKQLGATSPIITLEEADAVKSAVANGLGYAVLPGESVTLEEQAGLVTIDPLLMEAGRVMLVHRRPELLSAAARRLVGFLCASRRTELSWITRQAIRDNVGT